MDITNLEVGSYFTVLSWSHPCMGRSFIGDCLEVKAISDPFVRVVRRNKGFDSGSESTIDLRLAEIGQLSLDFITAVVNQEEGK